MVQMGLASTMEKILRVETILMSLNPACKQRPGLKCSFSPEDALKHKRCCVLSPHILHANR